MWSYTNNAIAAQCFGWVEAAGTKSAAYQEAGNWVGVCFAAQAVGSMIWASLIPLLKRLFGMKGVYAISIAVGALGFVAAAFIQNQYIILIAFALIGAAWAAMLAIPFTILTNALQGSKSMGYYLGLFNGTICLPQIVASILGSGFISLGITPSGMLAVAGILLVLGAASVFFIKEKH
jgi:maltose/moltooligosaccharide transporter